MRAQAASHKNTLLHKGQEFKSLKLFRADWDGSRTAATASCLVPAWRLCSHFSRTWLQDVVQNRFFCFMPQTTYCTFIQHQPYALGTVTTRLGRSATQQQAARKPALVSPAPAQPQGVAALLGSGSSLQLYQPPRPTLTVSSKEPLLEVLLLLPSSACPRCRCPNPPLPLPRPLPEYVPIDPNLNAAPAEPAKLTDVRPPAATDGLPAPPPLPYTGAPLQDRNGDGAGAGAPS